MPFLTHSPDSDLRALLDRRRILRWVYLGRLTLAAAIFVAALLVWQRATPVDTLLASLTFACAMVATVGSALYSEIYRKRVGSTFYYLQALLDLVLVTMIVHVTGGSASQFAALYILVIAAASLLLPIGGGLLVAGLGNVLYFADAIWGHDTALNLAVWLQLGVFAVVALGTGYLSARLQEAGAGKEDLAAELVKVRLQAADILHNIRSGILTVDDSGRLLYANPAAEMLLGVPLEALIGKPALEEIRGVAPELATALVRTVREGVRINRAEAIVDAAGRAYPIGLTTTVSEGDHKFYEASATAIFSDISDQKRLESLRLRAERLEGVAALSASLAHEIKNPLAAIRSSVEQLARIPGADDDSRTLSALIVRESDRLSRLLSEFLDFARVRVTRTARVDLGTIATGAATLAASHPDRKDGVSVTCNAPAEPLVVEGDEDLLHRAVFNLALNAVQAAPERGKVRIEVEPLPADQLPGGVHFADGAVAVRVSDDGPGIPADVRERMFDPFFTTKPGGTGLGLPVVHRAIEAHRGVVFVDSNGRGTRFTVLLPRTPAGNGAGTGGPQ